MILRYFLFCTLLSFSVKGTAQDIWDLPKCIAFALENNLSLKNADINYRIQKINYNQARLNQLPQIDGGISVNESFGRTLGSENTYVDENIFSNSFGVNASLLLFSGFSQRNRIAFERYNLKAEHNRFEQQKNKVIFTVIDSYFKVLLTRGLYTLYLEDLKIMQQQYASLLKFIQIGRKAESEIYDFEAKLATDSFLLIQQTGNVQKAMLLLKVNMNFPVNDTLLVDSIPPPFGLVSDSITSSSLTEIAKTQLPDLKVTENLLLAAKKNVASTRGYFSPNIEAFGGWNTSYYKIATDTNTLSFEKQFYNHSGEYVGLRLNVPLFNRFNKVNSVRFARLKYNLALNAHQEALQNMEREISEACIDWQTAQNEYLSAEKQLYKNNVAYQMAEKKMTIGQIHVIEFYIQKNELLRAKTELLRTNLQLSLKERYVQFLLNGKWLNN